MNKLLYLLCFLSFLGCAESDHPEIHFFRLNEEIVTIKPDDILYSDSYQMKFLLSNSKVNEINKLDLTGVSPSFAVFTLDGDTSIKVGICSSISSNCMFKGHSAFWFNYDLKSMFINDTLILYPPETGHFEEKLILFFRNG
jgi:hypothetical protein